MVGEWFDLTRPATLAICRLTTPTPVSFQPAGNHSAPAARSSLSENPNPNAVLLQRLDVDHELANLRKSGAIAPDHSCIGPAIRSQLTCASQPQLRSC